MIRLTLIAPDGTERAYALPADSATVGRAPDNDVRVDAPSASKRHGRFVVSGDGIVYEDLASTNGSLVRRGDRDIRLGQGGGGMMVRLERGDAVVIAAFELRLAEGIDESAEDDGPVTIMASRGDLDLGRIQDDIISADPSVARRFLRFVRDTHGVTSTSPLLDAIASFVFEAFPAATHQTLVVRDSERGIVPMLTRSRGGSSGAVRPSATVIDRVMDEGVALLFARDEFEVDGTDSVQQQGIETAIAAPLGGRSAAFGAIQLDVRSSSCGAFSKRDLDLLTAVAGHVALVLENLRLHAEQRTALESTINALVHSLSWKDPSTAEHSKRVRDIARIVGRELGLDESALEVLSMAAILHDLGKHGVPDEILFKPGALTPEEQEEVSKHAEYTQAILDEIFFPLHLRQVPQIAAWHHERMDGKGTYGIPGAELPVQARIIGACDAFDALFSDRPYREGRSVEEVLEILAEGRGVQWDADVVDTLCAMAAEIIALCYERRVDESGARRYPPEDDRRTASRSMTSDGREPGADENEASPSSGSIDADIASDASDEDDEDDESEAAA